MRYHAQIPLNTSIVDVCARQEGTCLILALRIVITVQEISTGADYVTTIAHRHSIMKNISKLLRLKPLQQEIANLKTSWPCQGQLFLLSRSN
jgi:hypothetical protein